jgi:hypothetical protein
VIALKAMITKRSGLRVHFWIDVVSITNGNRKGDKTCQERRAALGLDGRDARPHAS